uniref:Geminin n=1 Tax=Mus musculus TaxID=10090 RepID=H3BJH3_MOUSE
MNLSMKQKQEGAQENVKSCPKENAEDDPAFCRWISCWQRK